MILESLVIFYVESFHINVFPMDCVHCGWLTKSPPESRMKGPFKSVKSNADLFDFTLFTFAGDRRARNSYKKLHQIFDGSVQETCKTKMSEEQDAIESYSHSVLIVRW